MGVFGQLLNQGFTMMTIDCDGRILGDCLSHALQKAKQFCIRYLCNLALVERGETGQRDCLQRETGLGTAAVGGIVGVKLPARYIA